jgi:hypothetical protein
MTTSKTPQKVLIGIVILNLISTWSHYTHNAIFLDYYPGPNWFTAQAIMITVAVMSAIGLLGLRLMLWRSITFSLIITESV